MEKLLAAAEKIKDHPHPIAPQVYREVIIHTESIRVALGDEPFIAKLKQQAAGNDTTPEARHARAMLCFGNYAAAAKDEAAQAKVIADYDKFIKEDPANLELGAMAVRNWYNPNTTAASKDKIEAAIKPSKAPQVREAQEEWAAERKLNAFVDKPMVIKNFKLDGTEFSTESLKGKVIMIDFWATWCGPCVAELPRVTKVYEKYHDKGFEIVSVSFDKTVDPINTFLADHKEITWIQVFNPKTPLWDAGKEWGINSIPTYFIIDRKGICRTVHGRQELDTLVPKLLDEK
jgi:thiol-disulfide isomerase/thioredoxin